MKEYWLITYQRHSSYCDDMVNRWTEIIDQNPVDWFLKNLDSVDPYCALTFTMETTKEHFEKYVEKTREDNE